MVSGIKKDWMYDFNKAFRYFGLIFLLIGSIFLVSNFFVGGEVSEILFKIHNKVFNMLILMFYLYPIFILKSILPQFGTDKKYMEVNNLPFSKKEIFKDSLKYGAKKVVGFIFISGVINIFLSLGENTFLEGIVITFGMPIIGSVFGMILFFQVFTGVTLCFAKGVSGTKSLLTILIGNCILGGIIAVIANVLGKEFTDSFKFISIIIVMLFIPSLIAFLKYWDDIENICS